MWLKRIKSVNSTRDVLFNVIQRGNRQSARDNGRGQELRRLNYRGCPFFGGFKYFVYQLWVPYCFLCWYKSFKKPPKYGGKSN
ncbi:hypothetical protein Bhyg_06741 [Pseudolycoriella hygida]|uniref:Uncharacterized protein n=1 Tax=Pseudolycoriella hygida TaxID=35572 RepID=A0A9Q0N1D7_9DIPT|nr:hypothetical protein Bhyg_06741 [Pseudolycoriella hygida]